MCNKYSAHMDANLTKLRSLLSLITILLILTSHCEQRIRNKFKQADEIRSSIKG